MQRFSLLCKHCILHGIALALSETWLLQSDVTAWLSTEDGLHAAHAALCRSSHAHRLDCAPQGWQVLRCRSGQGRSAGSVG